MTFHLRTGEAHGIEPLQNPSPQKVEYEVRNTHLGSGDTFVVLVDETRDTFVQCALDDPDENHQFTLEYGDGERHHYRCKGWVGTDDVVAIFLAFLDGRAPILDDAWEDIGEDIYGVDLSDWD